MLDSFFCFPLIYFMDLRVSVSRTAQIFFDWTSFLRNLRNRQRRFISDSELTLRDTSFIIFLRLNVFSAKSAKSAGHLFHNFFTIECFSAKSAKSAGHLFHNFFTIECPFCEIYEICETPISKTSTTPIASDQDLPFSSATQKARKECDTLWS